MNRVLFCLVAIWTLAVGLSTVGAAEVGQIQFTDGEVSVSRAGKVLPAQSVMEGLTLEDQDTITTGKDGVLELAFRPAAGLTGVLKVSPQTVIRIELSRLSTGATGVINVLRGQLALKFDKLVGANQLNVKVATANLGVRGTQFEVRTAPAGEVLVITSEGKVECEVGGDSLWSIPGQAVEGAGSGDWSDLAYEGDEAVFSGNWMHARLEGLAANAPRAFRNFSTQYSSRIEGLRSARNRLLQEGGAVLATWTTQDAQGRVSPGADLIKEKKAVVGPLFAVARALRTLEWSWYRLQELRPLLTDSDEVRTFYRRFDGDVDLVSRALAESAAAQKQYIARNDGESPFVDDLNF